MAHSARDNRISRRCWLLAGLAIPTFRARAADPLQVTFDGDNLHVATPGLHFLTGKPLERLHNADTVAFVSQLTLYSDANGTVFRSYRDRFIVSYALWEEKFAVTIPGQPPRTQLNLTAAQAESFCIENLAISALGLTPDRPFWMKFELRTAAQKDLSSLLGESGISVSSIMIDLLSRKPGINDPYWSRSAGPLRLADLPRTLLRGTRNG
jgi:hypothetical protein